MSQDGSTLLSMVRHAIGNHIQIIVAGLHQWKILDTPEGEPPAISFQVKTGDYLKQPANTVMVVGNPEDGVFEVSFWIIRRKTVKRVGCFDNVPLNRIKATVEEFMEIKIGRM